MTRTQLDALWHKAMDASIRDGEVFTRYHFAALVAAAEREACAQVCEQIDTAAFDSNRPEANDCAAAIRARGGDQ